MRNSLGVLLLSHVGFSCMEDLVSTVAERGLKCYVLSSLPEPRHQESRPAALAELAEDVRTTTEHVLTTRDVDDYLDQLTAAGVSVLCCLTVWEGYRDLMALANARLGVADLDVKEVWELRDKLAVRNRIADAGLSRGRAAVLTPETLIERQRATGRYFVKPVSGIASYGAFPLTAGTSWADLKRIAAEAQSDLVYASALTNSLASGDRQPTVHPCSIPTPRPRKDAAGDARLGLEFLVEDYVPGKEFSFEVIVVDTEPRVVAIHEKCELTEAEGTVLENACVSPPMSLTQAEISAGIRWTAGVLDTLGLAWGCFHVEARHSPAGWDLIEVNPRVGGSLISASVEALTGGPGLLDLWLDSLLTSRMQSGFMQRLDGLSYAADGTTQSKTATFFRVFFADPGTIREVRLSDELPRKPVVSQVLLAPGDVVESSSREVFLGQMLWRMELAERESLLAELIPASEHAIDIAYEAVQP